MCHLSDITHPLRVLLSSKTAWVWGQEQKNAFTRVKEELTKPTVLALYHPGCEAKISAEAFSYGLGAVLLQRIDSTYKPIAYASRTLSKTEKRFT